MATHRDREFSIRLLDSGEWAHDWKEFSNQNTIRQIIEDGDQVVMEITAVIEDGEANVEYDLAVVLRWADNRLVYYRLYVDPIPDM